MQEFYISICDVVATSLYFKGRIDRDQEHEQNNLAFNKIVHYSHGNSTGIACWCEKHSWFNAELSCWWEDLKFQTAAILTPSFPNPVN